MAKQSKFKDNVLFIIFLNKRLDLKREFYKKIGLNMSSETDKGLETRIK